MTTFELRQDKPAGVPIVRIDGVEIPVGGMSGIRVEVGSDCRPVVTFEAEFVEVGVMGLADAKVVLAPGLEDVLRALGWTSPGETAFAAAEAFDEIADLVAPNSGIGLAAGAPRADISAWIRGRGADLRKKATS